MKRIESIRATICQKDKYLVITIVFYQVCEPLHPVTYPYVLQEQDLGTFESQNGVIYHIPLVPLRNQRRSL